MDSKKSADSFLAKRTFHIMECQEPWFSFIKKGIKTVEGRKGIDRWKKIKVGDTIVFTDGSDNNKFNAAVTGINVYEGKGTDSLKNYLETETLARALPSIKTMDDGMKVYMQWSTPEQLEKYGMLGIQVKLI